MAALEAAAPATAGDKDSLRRPAAHRSHGRVRSDGGV